MHHVLTAFKILSSESLIKILSRNHFLFGRRLPSRLKLFFWKRLLLFLAKSFFVTAGFKICQKIIKVKETGVETEVNRLEKEQIKRFRSVIIYGDSLSNEKCTRMILANVRHFVFVFIRACRLEITIFLKYRFLWTNISQLGQILRQRSCPKALQLFWGQI